MEEENKKNTIKVKLPEELEEGVFANAVSVHFNNNECILDFAYNLPNLKEQTVKIVSRINLSHKTAESFLKVLSNAVLDYKNRQNGKENTENN
ncbi:DUF3467 domain-containing protein [Candidatus Peregrinibacteria bacterium]|nr:DUF3467 domain-containing protein [Candidatus Peregrinibacteria bacterium]